MHAQIVADALGVPFDAIEVHEVDTAFVPDSGPTVASRTCMIVGKLLERCARDMRKRLGRLTPAQYFKQARLVHRDVAVRAAAGPAVGRRDAMRAMRMAATRGAATWSSSRSIRSPSK